MDRNAGGKFAIGLIGGVLIGTIFDNIALGILFGLFLGAGIARAKRREP